MYSSKKALWTVAGVSLAAALAMVFIGFDRQGFVVNIDDPYKYGEIARGFLENGFDKVTRRAAMLYPHLLWFVYWAGGTNFTVQLIQVAMHVASCVLVFVIGTRLYNVRTALLGGLATALHPMLLRYVADLHTETLLVFGTMVLVWCAIRFYDRPTVANGILLGAVGMIATLIKGVALPIVLAYVAFIVLREVRRNGVALPILVSALAVVVTMAVVVAPWTYRNYRVSGRFVLLTPGTADSFLRGYIFTRMEFATFKRSPYVDAETESNNWFKKIAADAGTTWEQDEIVDEANNKAVMKRMIREQPLDTARKFVVGLFTFWYEMTTLFNSMIPAGLAVVCWILTLIGWKRSHAEGRPAWLLLLPIVITNVLVAALIPLGRYSVPILPCLVLLAAFGVDTLLDRQRRVEAL